jgi:hypothetical protein
MLRLRVADGAQPLSASGSPASLVLLMSSLGASLRAVDTSARTEHEVALDLGSDPPGTVGTSRTVALHGCIVGYATATTTCVCTRRQTISCSLTTLGSVYDLQGGGAGGGPVTIHGNYGFAPTLPPEATRVYVDADGVRFTMAVA